MTGHTMVEHHVKYKELHGVDETVWMTDSEHKKLHFRLRKEQKCNIPVSVLTKISIAAHNRTDKEKEFRSEYNKKNIQCINFNDTVDLNVIFTERITYNHATGNVSYFAAFYGRHEKKLWTRDI